MTDQTIEERIRREAKAQALRDLAVDLRAGTTQNDFSQTTITALLLAADVADERADEFEGHCKGHGAPGRWYCCQHPDAGWPCSMTSEAQNTPVSAPSGPSAGLEGQGAADRDRALAAADAAYADAWAAEHGARAALDRAEADRDRPITCAHCGHEHAGKGLAGICIGCPCPGFLAADAEKDATITELRADVERLRKPTVAAVMGYELGAGDLEHAEARVAELEATVAEVRAEVEHWKDHAEEAGQGFTRVCKDYAQTAARNSDLLRRIQTALARSRQVSGQAAWTLAQLQNDLDVALSLSSPGAPHAAQETPDATVTVPSLAWPEMEATVAKAKADAFDEGRRCGLRQADWEYGVTPTMPDLANPYYRAVLDAPKDTTAP